MIVNQKVEQSKQEQEGSDFKALVAYMKGLNVNALTSFVVTNQAEYEAGIKNGETRFNIDYTYIDSSTEERQTDSLTLVHSKVSTDTEEEGSSIFDYYSDVLLREGWKLENIGHYILYFICFGWIWMPLVNWEV